MLTCKEIVRMLSSGEEFGPSKRARIRMHLFICKYCSNYNLQLSMVKDAIQKLYQKRCGTEDEKLSELESEIIKKHARYPKNKS